jgi:hypothetical protein
MLLIQIVWHVFILKYPYALAVVKPANENFHVEQSLVTGNDIQRVQETQRTSLTRISSMLHWHFLMIHFKWLDLLMSVCSNYLH